MNIQGKSVRTRLAPDQRRAQLLCCAISAFAEHGVARATHAHVAERAGVSVSAVHSYFRTRDDLVAATLGEVEAYFLEIVSSFSAKKVPMREALSMLVARFDQAAQDDSDVIKVWLDWSTGFRGDVWPRYLSMQDRVLEQVQRILTRGKRHGQLCKQINTKAAARLYVGGGHTIVLARFAGAARREIDILIDHLVRGVTCTGAEISIPCPNKGPGKACNRCDPRSDA